MLHHRVNKYIECGGLFTKKDKLLVALSGGADSVALLRVLLQSGYSCEAAHCNFHLRGEESCRDEAFVRRLCADLEIPLHVIDFDTVAYAEAHQLSIEMAARELRYNWFEELSNRTGCKYIAVAHHRDDSVETFLLNLIRGTGINGLCGIRPKNGKVVRPLLDVSRKDIIAYLDLLKQDYVTDSTNLQDEYTRNKIRLNLIPMMEEINPSVKEGIALTASRLSDVAIIYKVEMEKACRRVCKDGKGISIDALLAEPAPQAVLFEILSPLGFNSAQVGDVFQSLTGQSGKVFFSPEWRLVKDRTDLLPERLDEVAAFPVEPATLPQSGELTYATHRLETECIALTDHFTIPRRKTVACLDYSKLQFPLTVRRWKKGDAFVPFGMKGKKLVSDYLTDCKFSLQEKEKACVICSGEDIVWLVGERSDNRFRIDESTAKVLLIRLLDEPE